MNLNSFSNIDKSFFVKIFIFLLLLLLLPIFATFFFIKEASLSGTEKTLSRIITQVKKDLIYKNGKWDTSLYNSDRNLPSPNSLNSYPFYIITADGFVIVRNSPISGLLDSADSKHLLKFTIPSTITTPTNESYRILSKPIVNNGKTLGTVAVSSYSPDQDLEQETDNKLNQSINNILTKVKINENRIILDSLDLRTIPYDISYSVVDNLNKVIVTNGRVPSYIDPSYFASELNKNKRIVEDENSKERFLVMSQAIYDDKNKSPIGVIVMGRSVNNLFSVLNSYLIFSFITRLLITIPLTIFAVLVLRRELVFLLKPNDMVSFKNISFDSSDGTIQIDNKKIQMPFSSNQYYLCKAVFSSPKKLWEVDELLEKMGENTMSGKGRKIYDAMLAANKRIGLKIIIHRDKIYKFNPDFITKIYAAD